jgi:hypothetical protein
MYTRERQYKRKIKLWHLEKNVKDAEIQFIVYKQKKRKIFQDKDTVFHVRGRAVEPEKIARTVKRKNISGDVLLSALSPGKNY